MKISKKRLRQIIREEKARLSSDFTKVTLNEARFGAGSVGFADWSANKKPDFAKAYGKDARVIGTYGNNNNDLTEQPMPAPTADPVETAFQELKYSGAYKEFQEALHDAGLDLEGLRDKHMDMMVQADQGSIVRNLDDLIEDIDMLRKTFSSLR